MPTVIDPGQGLPLFERDELVELIDGADVYIVNDYEWSLTLSRSALSEEDDRAPRRRRGGDARREGLDPAARRRAGGRTRRSRPSAWWIRPAAATPTAPAFLHGLSRGLPLETCARMGSLLGSLKVAEHGTQGLSLDARRVPGALRREPSRAELP